MVFLAEFALLPLTIRWGAFLLSGTACEAFYFRNRKAPHPKAGERQNRLTVWT